MTEWLSRNRIIALLCLLLFQLQVFAASTLGCVHGDAGSAGPIHCIHGADGGSAAATGSPDHDDGGERAGAPCQKCSLGHCASGWHLLPDAGVQSAPRPAPVQAAGKACHYYHFTPDSWQKPPIPLSS
ncbi:MAG: hypothetical protein K9M02_02630 [Thiohalocapsa sp.]|nr:hypothetical protein [Thiohalocapsa sp.]